MKTLDQVAFAHRGKIKKAEVARLLRQLAELHPESVELIGKVLALHQPTDVKVASDFGWVALAVANRKELRKYLQYVMCDGTMAVATDGTMMLAAPCTDRAPGLYDPKSGQRVWPLWENAQPTPDAAHPGKFPDWRRILPAPGHRKSSTSEHSRLRIGEGDYIRTERWVIPERQWHKATRKCDTLMFGTELSDSVAMGSGEGHIAVLMSMRTAWLEKMGVEI